MTSALSLLAVRRRTRRGHLLAAFSWCTAVAVVVVLSVYRWL
jgi:hypothetical protein